MKKAGETASSTWGQFGALSTENEVGTWGILDGSRQDSSEKGKWSWQRADPTALYQLSKTRRRQGGGKRTCLCTAALSGSGASWIGQKMLGTQQWYTSGRVRSIEPNQRFKVEVPGTLVLDMSGVLAVQAVPSQSILFVEAWPSGNLSSKWVSWASGSWTLHAGVPFTRTHLLNLSADSKVGCGAGDRHGQHADGNLAVRPLTSESLPARTLIVMWASEWQQNQTVYALVDEGSLLDPGGASLGNRDSNVVMEGQVTVPGGTVTFSVGKVSTMTTIVISPTVSLARAEEDTSMFFQATQRLGWISLPVS